MTKIDGSDIQVQCPYCSNYATRKDEKVICGVYMCDVCGVDRSINLDALLYRLCEEIEALKERS